MSRYRIQAVSRICGVPPATLRAWERRYGLPAPARTASAYRLYSDEDIALIMKMRDLVRAGVAAAEAARAVLTAAKVVAKRDEVSEEDPFNAAADRIVDAVQRFDPDGIEREVGKALAIGSAVAIFDGALGPALRRIGDLWQEGLVSVAQEHLASAIIGGALLYLLRLLQPSDASRRVVLACVADEEHTLGLYGVGLRFTTWGIRTLVLGPRTPPSAIARAVEALRPDVVALSATTDVAPSSARSLVDAYADACGGTAWIVGGAGSIAMKPRIEERGGIVAPEDPADMRRVVEAAMRAHRRRRLGLRRGGKDEPNQ